jgi:hypothetical protein
LFFTKPPLHPSPIAKNHCTLHNTRSPSVCITPHPSSNNKLSNNQRISCLEYNKLRKNNVPQIHTTRCSSNMTIPNVSSRWILWKNWHPSSNHSTIVTRTIVTRTIAWILFVSERSGIVDRGYVYSSEIDERWNCWFTFLRTYNIDGGLNELVTTADEGGSLLILFSKETVWCTQLDYVIYQSLMCLLEESKWTTYVHCIRINLMFIIFLSIFSNTTYVVHSFNRLLLSNWQMICKCIIHQIIAKTHTRTSSEWHTTPQTIAQYIILQLWGVYICDLWATS